MDHLFYLCLVVFFLLSRLFIAALWSPAEKGPTSWLSLVMINQGLPIQRVPGLIVFLSLSHVVSWARCGT